MKKFISYLFLVFALTMFSTSYVSAQRAKLKKAEKLFEAYNYQEAIEIYLKILVKNDVAEAKINLAECYRKVNNATDTEFWYGQVVRLPESEPIHKLYYAMALQSNGKCTEAKDWFAEYTRLVPDDLRGVNLAKGCGDDEAIDDLYEINHLPINTTYDDFGSTTFGDGFVFASERDKGWAVKRTHTWTGNPFLELFFVPIMLENKETMEYSYGKVEKFSNKLNTRFHDAALSFSEDEQVVFFTRNNFVDGNLGKDDDDIVRLKIYFSTAVGDSWSDPQSLPFNSDEYSTAHPSLSKDGKKLYFSSDMPGGFGGMDLYVSNLENDRWSPPRNLGAAINTEGDEVFPFVHESNDLYFASKGHVGLGGLDIYYLKNNEGVFGPVENVGYPLNTKGDDFGFVINEEKTFGFLSSNREGGAGGDDIYSFVKKAIEVEIFVFDELTNEPLENASVLNKCNGSNLKTNKKGRVTLSIPLDKCCEFIASLEEYEEGKKKACTTGIPLGEKIFVEIPLKSTRALEFTISGTVFDQETKQPLEGVAITITNDCDEEGATITTDATGKYSFPLSKECCYDIRAEKQTYLTDVAAGTCTRGMVASNDFQRDLFLDRFVEPVEARTTDENITSNQVVYTDKDGQNYSPKAFLLHIYYDFNQSYIREDANSELDRLLSILVENPGINVEISSHTDARGSIRYNKSLSSRRAESVVRWLRDKGIDQNRLKPKGYGESSPVNNCKDFVPCSEEQHQRNRRTEFLVVGTSDGVVNSVAPESVNVNPCHGCPF